ncbi:MAG: ribonucleoside-diphosphate reductase [Faunusvirus sp.]|jgi:ribonucleotide reductase beta subunit family protein with ferritin-like domain|uniref:Ribonucleoside-diphosphate reductase small chain n=1 Tax=Faunusvirus sp. TaxID=2487766 RepID=A0A3G4ZYE9_9VIRU|nr:MAG: ribonucleoside-diphosphate reductase [Faunusvirus sp.]
MSIIEEKEELLGEENARFTTYPIKYQKVWDMYEKQLASIWQVNEVDLSKDANDWVKLNADEQYFVKMVLAFFAASDGIVNLNITERFMKDVQITEAKYFYRLQTAMEDIHSTMYSLLIDTYIRDAAEKTKLFNAIQTIPCVKRKADWALKWITDDKESFSMRLIAFVIVEGIFFSGSFCSIFWLADRNLMPGLSKSNEFISRDEGMHCDFACLLYGMIKNRLSYDKVKSVFMDAVNIEKEFICESLPCNLIGMNSKLMSQYIEFVADRLISQLNYPKIYNTTNPFDFMEKIGANSKTNFFEDRVSEYQKANLNQNNSGFKYEFTTDF